MFCSCVVTKMQNKNAKWWGNLCLVSELVQQYYFANWLFIVKSERSNSSKGQFYHIQVVIPHGPVSRHKWILAFLICYKDGNCFSDIFHLDSLKMLFFTFSNPTHLKERQHWVLGLLWCVFITTNLSWIIFRSFHTQSASHLPLVYWRHYSYKWTFVLKECRVCRRVGGWEGDSSPAVCRGLLFHPD